MAKPALGRGLGTLLGGDKIAGKTTVEGLSQPGGSPPAPGRGVGTLLLKVQPETPDEPAVRPEFPAAPAPALRVRPSLPAAAKPKVPYGYFLAADALCLIGAALIVFLTRHPVGWLPLTAAGLLVAGGAAVALWPFRPRREIRRPDAPTETPKWMLGQTSVSEDGHYIAHLHEPQFIARVVVDGEKFSVVPVSALAWSRISHVVAEQLLREAQAYCEAQAANNGRE